jgi:peptide/nickel transport system permease protein
VKGYLLKRLLLLPVTLFGVTLLCFLVIHLAPGDPGSLKRHGMSEGRRAASEADRGSEDFIAKWRAERHLDRPVHEQYFLWLGKLSRGDLGKTFFGDKDVWEEMKPHLWRTVGLEVVSLLLIFALAIPLGIFSAWKPDSTPDRVLSLGLFVLYSLPGFWVATMLILWLGSPATAPFGFHFPVSGLWSPRATEMTSWEAFRDVVWHAFLPVVCLSYGTLAVVSRYMRSGMLEVIRQDFIRTARAKGLPESRVILRHALRNALFPIVTFAAQLLPVLVAGSIIIEVIFTIPGMGWYAYDAIGRREYNVLMATFLLTGVVELVALLLADIAYAMLDPRVTYEGKAA